MSGQDKGNLKGMHGWGIDMNILQLNCSSSTGIKEMYSILLENVTMKNNSLIPSRREKRLRGIPWKATWRNMGLLRGLDPQETSFAWKLSQDLVEVGQRMHRRGANKQCLRLLNDGSECRQLESLEHRIFFCSSVVECGWEVKNIISTFIDREVNETEMLCLSFKTRRRDFLQVALWVAVKGMYAIHMNSCPKKDELTEQILVDMNWNLQNHVIGSRQAMMRMIVIIENIRKHMA